MSIDDDVLAAMERVVSAATPGPWTVEEESEGDVGDGDYRLLCIPQLERSLHDSEWADAKDWKRDQRNATYIARFDPPTLTALLAVVKAAQALVDKQAGERGYIVSGLAYDEFVDALNALTRPPQGAGGE